MVVEEEAEAEEAEEGTAEAAATVEAAGQLSNLKWQGVPATQNHAAGHAVGGAGAGGGWAGSR